MKRTVAAAVPGVSQGTTAIVPPHSSSDSEALHRRPSQFSPTMLGTVYRSHKLEEEWTRV